jgi:hypothetical protein
VGCLRRPRTGTRARTPPPPPPPCEGHHAAASSTRASCHTWGGSRPGRRPWEPLEALRSTVVRNRDERVANVTKAGFSGLKKRVGLGRRGPRAPGCAMSLAGHRAGWSRSVTVIGLAGAQSRHGRMHAPQPTQARHCIFIFIFIFTFIFTSRVRHPTRAPHTCGPPHTDHTILGCHPDPQPRRRHGLKPRWTCAQASAAPRSRRGAARQSG